ncbi:MAG: hypothetical protein ACOCX2_12320, partial [Armatimonadota bacterium]
PEEIPDLGDRPELPSDLAAHERAQLIAYQAAARITRDPEEARSRAERALEIDPNCIDAFLCLAQVEYLSGDDPLALRQKALEAATARLERGVPHYRFGIDDLWPMSPANRCIVRAHGATALSLWDHGDHAEAVRLAERTIALNPTDNMGIRWDLVNWYLIEQASGKAYKLLRRYSGERVAPSLFAGALVEFLRSGPGNKALRALLDAAEHNAGLLSQAVRCERRPPECPPEVDTFVPGEATEVVFWQALLWDAWHQYPEAIEWAHECLGRPEFMDASLSALVRLAGQVGAQAGSSAESILLDALDEIVDDDR